MKYHDDNNEAFVCQWLTDITKIDEIQWKAIFGKKHIKGFNFFKSIQQSNIPNVEFHYFIISENSKLVAIVPCFYFKLDLIDLLEESILKNILLKIRGVFPRFLKIRTLVIGSYASSCEYFVGICDEYKNNQEAIFSLIKIHLKKKAKKIKAKLTLIKEVRETQIDNVRATLGEDFCFCKSFPNTFVPVFSECRPYPSALKPNHQRRHKKMRKEYDKFNTWEIAKDITPYKNIFEEMYLNVLRKAKNKMEILNGEFFVNLNKNLPDNTFFIISRDVNKLIRAMALVVEEEDRLVPLYLGMNYRDDDTRIFYINMLFKVIETAEQKGKEIVELGQTSYYPKIMSGAFVEFIYYGFSSYNTIIKRILRRVVQLNLFDIKLLPHIYKKEKSDSIISKSENEYGFKICNLEIVKKDS